MFRGHPGRPQPCVFGRFRSAAHFPLYGSDQINPRAFTANDSKASTTNPLVRFTVSRTATVSVAVDSRLGRRSWMDSTWVDSGTSIRDNESTPRTFEVFTKTFPAGQVSLGPNGSSSSSMYMIIVT
jgi:hypothetical protein